MCTHDKAEEGIEIVVAERLRRCCCGGNLPVYFSYINGGGGDGGHLSVLFFFLFFFTFFYFLFPMPLWPCPRFAWGVGKVARVVRRRRLSPLNTQKMTEISFHDGRHVISSFHVTLPLLCISFSRPTVRH
jgi:hypothetical protein